MTTLSSISLLLGLLLAPHAPPAADAPDPTELRERLHDRQHPYLQNQAAMLLVQSRRPEAIRIVRQGLLQPEDTDIFLALTSALRLAPDVRYLGELLAALTVAQPGPRQAAAETLAAMPAADLVTRLRTVAVNGKLNAAARRAALWTLGRCGRKQAAVVLLEQLNDADGPLRGAAADALADLSGQSYGLDADRWQAWWERYKDLPEERWLELRLAHQASRAQRLEGDLARARAQILHLHQQLYSRLPAGERLGHIEATLDQEDPAARILAASWALEMLPGADATRSGPLPFRTPDR
jgi:HEAT repeat protein